MTKILSVATASVLTDQLADIDHRRYPRVDYIELQRLLDIETIDYSTYNVSYAGKFFRRLETQLRSDVYMATLSWWKSRSHPLTFAWSERAGIPLAAYNRYVTSYNRFVTMFQCWSDRQELAVTRFDLLPAMDEIIVHCTSMKKNLVRLGAPETKVKIVHYSIDQNFFTPAVNKEQSSPMIMSVGEPRSRNYPLLFQSVEGLPVRLIVAGYGHWYAREKKEALPGPVPSNVFMTSHLSQAELRELYARSQFVVLPIRDLVYSAGATAALEAGSMARAVVAFRSKGIVDYIIDGETGILVEPGNAAEMREAIQFLLANPKEARRLGQNARQRIVEELNFERYVSHIADLLTENEQAKKRSVTRAGLSIA